MGIGCDYCAWCVDETVIALDLEHQIHAAEDRAVAQEHEAKAREMRRG